MVGLRITVCVESRGKPSYLDGVLSQCVLIGGGWWLCFVKFRPRFPNNELFFVGGHDSGHKVFLIIITLSTTCCVPDLCDSFVYNPFKVELFVAGGNSCTRIERDYSDGWSIVKVCFLKFVSFYSKDILLFELY